MKLRTLISATMALTLLGSSVVMAAPWEDDRDQNRHFQQNHQGPHHWQRGEHLPSRYRGNHYVVNDWHARHFRAPPRGYHYVRTDEGDIVLAAIATGVVLDIALSQR